MGTMIMKSIFTFAGRASSDFYITIEKIPPYITPERIIESYSVPGRSGSLVKDTGTYSNYTQPYEIWFRPPKGITAQMQSQNVMAWLQGVQGYQRLEDSYNPDVYRKAVFSNPVEFEDWFFKFGRGTVEFNCMPQRWLKNGEIPVEVASGQKLYNAWMPAEPFIEITGSGQGTLKIGDATVGISSIPAEGITIDCEMKNAYNGLNNCNNLITLTNDFPALERGENTVTFSGGITSVKITPRWWCV